jgi:hypothetical protein|tara:strand:+ start:137 stop:556 length:420 start_codon:yes stop_codon:yes gene_type:complete
MKNTLKNNKLIKFIRCIPLMFLLFSSKNISADLVTLKCAPEGYGFESMILIDLDKKSFSFGHKDQMVYASKYKIIHVDEEWITAITMKAYDIGADVYVLNRVNGEYFKVGIANYCTDSSCSQTKVSTSKSKGLCKSGLF